MPPRKKKPFIPDFRSEEEEIEFWDTHDWEDYEDEPVTDFIINLKPRPKTRITMWVDTPVLEALKRLAAPHKMGYQTLARALLRIGVRRLEEAWASNSRRGRAASSARRKKRSAKPAAVRKSREAAQ